MSAFTINDIVRVLPVFDGIDLLVLTNFTAFGIDDSTTEDSVIICNMSKT